MKRFQRRKTQPHDHHHHSEVLLSDDTDYMSTIPGLEVEKKNALPISEILKQFDDEVQDDRGVKKRKINDLMETVRAIGMQTSLLPVQNDSQAVSKRENIGWKLLQKFGYQEPAPPSSSDFEREENASIRNSEPVVKGLGKNENGITEPLFIMSSTNRDRKEHVGLGRREQLLRDEARKTEKLNQTKEQFTNYWQVFAEYSRKHKEYLKIVKVIYELDLRQSEAEVKELEIEFSTPETRDLHQRNQQGLHLQRPNNLPTVSYNDEEEENQEEALTQLSNKESNYDTKMKLFEFPSPKDLKDSEDEIRIRTQEINNRIYSLLMHLRKYYSYCYYCAVHFNHLSELSQVCKAVTESDHEENDEWHNI